MKSFTCLSLNPISLEPPGIALATAKAGGVGILDLELLPKGDFTQGMVNFEKLLSLTKEGDCIGLRLCIDQIVGYKLMLEKLVNRQHWLILADWNARTLAEAMAPLPKSTSRTLLLEVLDTTQIDGLKEPQVNGLIAKGNEAAGWVGEDATFILLQKLLASQSLPVYAQGGIGIHTAAGCRAAGAAGVVLDDQLWLMPNSPLPEKIKNHLKNLNGQEAIAIGERLGKSCRVLSRPGLKAVTALQKLAEDIEIAQEESPERRENWQNQAQPLIGWGDTETVAPPMGQAVGLAVKFQENYRTIGRLIQAIYKNSAEQVQTAQDLKPLQPDSPLARSHGTKYPIMQGPMTRVSDVAEFANAVSSAGGLPMLALALMKGTQVKTLLEKAQQLTSDRAWGVGILGFVPSKLKEEQLAVVKQIKPPFALIAGGRPDQAAQLEAEGIATYIHVPTPTLLKMFLEQGAKRFVFEGRECGGHVGPLSSFILWESMIDTLLQHRFSGTESDIHLFFAGGIHDHISAAMVAAMAAPLAARGMKIGVLMGTAYILTQEAVECGAIVPEFQQQILKCDRTINLETGPGHASRCAVTPFAQEFYETRRKMMVEGASPEEIKDTLEDLTLGRLRLASKGLMRDEQGQVITLDAETQVKDGMYMIGQVATLHDQAYTVEELHENVSLASTELLTSIDITEVGTLSNQPTPSDIAIVGVATLLPKAQSGREYWENIINKVDAITEIPQDRWDWRLYFHQDRRTRDKIYSKWGGFLEDVPFDPMGFGIPPKSLKSIEPMQLLALETVRQALVDAGYEDQNFDREHTSVILGCGGGIGDLGQQYATRSEIPRMVGENAPDETWDRLPEWTEESFPGVLLNVVAGRIASRFDFGGSNFTVDAACASSLAAIELAVKELETGRANVAIAGGVDTVQSPFAYFCFSKTQALSPRGKCHTFDQSADGIVISEGIAMVVLKRLADAERDGDRIYAVIKAVAGSSDGKALGLTAPLPSGQRRAVKRAAAKSGINPSTWSLYEAHGTGTVAGDRAELETLMQTLAAENAASKSVVLGSVKTMIGHTKSSAGVAGLIKVALALHHKVLPPHRNVDKPLEPITQPDSPVYLLKEAHPWLANPAHPRRGAVSAFGFGGTNFHAVLEEYQGNFVETDLGAPSWSHELLIFRAANREGLIKEIKNLQTALEAAAEPRLADLAYSYAKLATIKKNQPYCLAIVTTCLKQLQTDLVIALDMIAGKQISPGNAIAIGDNAATKQAPIAFLFSGQGSQYPQMMREVALYFPEMREFLEFADQQLQETLPKPLSQYIYPPSAYSEAEENTQVEELKNTKIAQPAIGTIQLGLIKILARLNLAASMTAGHSYGEYTALCAAGVVKEADFLQLSALRGQVMADACQHTDGAMAAVQMNREELSQRLKEFSGVLIANHNAPMQSVISGDREIVVKAVSTLNAEGIRATMLPVSGAFHTPLVVAANQPLTEAIAQTKFARPRIPVYGNATGQHYHPDPKVIKNQLEKHLVSKVEFVQEIEKMYADGARVFIEIGPKNFLSKFTRQILENHEHLAVALDDYGGGLKGFLRSLATLIINGVDLNLTGLFAGRTVQQLDLSRLIETQKPVISKTTWLVNGGSSRPQTESVGYMGKIPPLNQESMALARKTQVNLDGEVKTAPVVVNGTTIPEPRKNGHPKTPPITATPTKSPATSKNLPVQELATRKEVKSLPSMPKESNYPENNLVVSQSGISGQEALLGYQAYQETMRQFLKLEEKVMQQFLMGQVVEQKTNDIVGKQPQPAFKQQNPSNISVPTAVKPFVPVATRQPIEIPQRQTPVTAVIPVPVVKPEVVKQEAQSKLERAELIQILVELVSDRTGYPGEMLGLDQDLEAELGIDSIKRVEILGALAKILPSDLAQTLNQQMESLTRVKSLHGLVEQLLQSQSQVVRDAGSNAGNNQAPATPQVTTLERAELIQILVELVSDRTGYPGEMLGLDQDLEAELGIDSIKRVEILGALAKILPSDLAQTLNQQMESLTRVKSLNSLVDKLLSTQLQLNLGKSNGETQANIASVSPIIGTIPRYTMQPVAETLPQANITSFQGLFLITEDQLSCAEQLALALETKGAKTAILTAEILLNPEKLALEVEELRQKFGSVVGIVHLAGLSPLTMQNSLSQWRQYTASQAKSLLYLLGLCQEDLQEAAKQKAAHVLSASLFGGYFGRKNSQNRGLATAGAAVGLLKTLITEWEGINAKAVDFDPNLSIDSITEQILQELSSPGRLEVGYPQGQRTIFQTVVTPLETTSQPQLPQADWVVLITGGAMGITAEIANDLANIGLTLIIVGRSPYPEAESSLTQEIEDLSTLRKILLQTAIAKGEKPTPVQIEAKVQKLLKERQLTLNLERFRQAGAKVEYHSVDVRNEAEFGQIIDETYQRYGRLDAVIHGAGIIEDKLIVDKTPESFNRVFDTKVDSGFILSQHLRPESLKLLVFFSSVAGRYGNRGQSDYAMANETINRLAWQLQSQWQNTHIVAINWGPWDTAGMASEGVKRQFRERGIIPIPLEGGRQFFTQEILYGQPGVTEVIAGEGPWEAYEATQQVNSSIINADYPLLLQQPELQPNGSVILEHTFTLASDPYLTDHRLDQKPVLPAAGALEWMAELVQQAWPDWIVTEIRDLRVMRGLVLEQNESKSVLFKARSSTHADSSTLAVTIEIIDPEKKLPYYRAAVILHSQIPDSPRLEAVSIISGQSLDPKIAYQNYLFHGQYFQLITAIEQISEQGIDAQVIPTNPLKWLNRSQSTHSQWLFDPGLIDTAPQLAIVWARVNGDTTALPSRFGSVIRYSASQQSQPLHIAFRVKEFDGNSLNYDAIFFDSNGRVHFHLQDISGTCNAALNRLAR